MKTSLRVILALLAVQFLSLATRCCDDEGLLTIPQEADIESISTSNLDNSGEGAFISQFNSIPSGAYGIEVQFETQFLASTPRIPKSNGWGLMAYAATSCDYDDPMATYTRFIEDLQVVTLQDFDDDHQAGDTITDLFRYRYTRENTVQYTEIEGLATDLRLKQRDNQFLGRVGLYLFTAPTEEKSYQFAVNLHMDDSTMLSDTTESIMLVRP